MDFPGWCRADDARLQPVGFEFYHLATVDQEHCDKQLLMQEDEKHLSQDLRAA